MLDVASVPIQPCMSSLRTSWRVRPKSPPLQPPSVTLIQSSARAGDEIGTCRFVRIGKHVSGMANVLRSAPTTTAPRGRTLFRSAATAGFIERTFDPDNGKNQNGSHAFAGSTIHA